MRRSISLVCDVRGQRQSLSSAAEPYWGAFGAPANSCWYAHKSPAKLAWDLVRDPWFPMNHESKLRLFGASPKQFSGQAVRSACITLPSDATRIKFQTHLCQALSPAQIHSKVQKTGLAILHLAWRIEQQKAPVRPS